MIRDEKMAQLVPNNKEPITPLLHKIKSLFNEKGISSIIVMGGSGDYFTVADLVLWMDCYECKNVTKRAKEIAVGSGYTNDHSTFGGVAGERCPNLAALAPDGKVSVRSKSIILYGDTELDLSCVEQIVGLAQTKSILAALQLLASSSSGSTALSPLLVNRNSSVTTLTILQVLKALDDLIDLSGLSVLSTRQYDGDLAKPRRFEIAGALNRLRIEKLFSQKLHS